MLLSGKGIWENVVVSFPYEACPARPLDHRTGPENKLDVPVAFRNASCRDPVEETADTQIAEMESTAAERYHLESELNEI